MIVEDHLDIQEYLEQTILSIGDDVTIFKTQYAQEALIYAQNNKVDIFILDIQLLDSSGIELARKIRELRTYLLTPIIFSTAIPTNELEAYRTTHCYKYLIKPYSEQKIIEVLHPLMNQGSHETVAQESYFTTMEEEEANLLLRQNYIIYNIKLVEIIFVEYKNRKVMIHTNREQYIFASYTLKQIEEMLIKNFIRCHKGYIVNKDFIHKVVKGKYEIHLKDSDYIIPLGRKYLGNLEEYR